MTIKLCVLTGKDATVDFEDVGHSDSAIEMMHKYFVGHVDTSTVPTKVDHNSPPSTQTQAQSVRDQSSGFVAKTLQFLLPLLILAFAFAMQHYGKKKQVSDS
jgi:cytochrome b5